MREIYLDRNELSKILTTSNSVDLLPPFIIYNIHGEFLEIKDYLESTTYTIELPTIVESLKRALEERMNAIIHIVEGNNTVILGEL